MAPVRTTVRPVTLSDRALILGATMRLTRAVVTDDIGDWWVRQPITAYFQRRHHDRMGEVTEGTPCPGHRCSHLYEQECGPNCWPMGRYLSGLDCPYCVGFWIGAGVMASHALARAIGPKALSAWRFGAGALTLNQVAARLNVAVGDV